MVVQVACSAFIIFFSSGMMSTIGIVQAVVLLVIESVRPFVCGCFGSCSFSLAHQRLALVWALVAAQLPPDKKTERAHGTAQVEPQVQERAGGSVLMALFGLGPSQMGGGEHEGEKVWQVVAAQAFPELVPAQLCDPTTRQCSSATFWSARSINSSPA